MGSTDPIHEEERRYSSHVFDYRKLNKVTIQNRYPLSRIDNLFNQLEHSGF